MEDDNDKLSGSEDDKKFYYFIIGFLIWMAFITIWYFTYPFPNGKGSILSFIIIFLREIIIAGFLIIILVFAAFKMLINRDHD